MITIQGKQFRNFAEQINKNKEDIYVSYNSFSCNYCSYKLY